MNIKRRITRLENATSTPDLVLTPITDDMDDVRACQVYQDNLKSFNEHYRKYPRKPVDASDLTDEEAALHVKEMLDAFPA